MCVGDDRGDGLVDVVLYCCGDSFEEDLRWEPMLGFSVELMELDYEANAVGVTLLKTVEALGGTFFFSTSVELKTKGAGGRGAGREIIDSNTSLPSILTPKRFSLFLRSVLTDRILPDLLFRQVLGTELWLSDFNDHVCDQGYDLFGSEIKCVVERWR